MSTKWRSLALILWLSLYASLAPAQQPSWETLNTAGMYAYNQGQYPKAKRLFCEALDSLESTSHADPRLVHTLNNLGAAQEALGEYAQAELSYRQSLTIVEKIQGSDHPDLVLGLNN
ncbi:MAG: tetratricopeptide repeat protein, partial [Candidatus Binatia bacterium]